MDWDKMQMVCLFVCDGSGKVPSHCMGWEGRRHGRYIVELATCMGFQVLLQKKKA